VTPGDGIVLESLLTFVLVILNTAHEHSLVGTGAVLAVGAAITVVGLIGGELTTVSMNPVRALGPTVVSGHYTRLWVFGVDRSSVTCCARRHDDRASAPQ
jgi:aquaporin NIP